jgi:hypothetical protein
MKTLHLVNRRLLPLACVALAAHTHGAFVPIPLTADSFNQDIVVEKTAPSPILPVTTASMDAGTANTNFTWFERGYNADWPATGLPVAGTMIESDGIHYYQLPSSYETNNAVLIDASCTAATLALTVPTACATLSFLAACGGGSGTAGIVRYTVHHQDATTEAGTFTCPNWWGGVGNTVWSASGRVSVSSFTFDGLNSDNARLFAGDINLTNTSSPVTAVDLAYQSGTGHNAVFALSTAASAGDQFAPAAVTGYNQDLVVEASAVRNGFLNYVTTATMANGTDNIRQTWYEQGYYSAAPQTGLPAAGSTLISQTASDHQFVLPPAYANNNAVLVDAGSSVASLTPATPASVSALSFLTAAGNGPATLRCVVYYDDGASETNSFIAPDWFDSAPAAFAANGRVSISTKIVDAVNTGAPRLFAVDIPLSHTTSALTNLVLSFVGSGNAHAVILAVSGAPVAHPRPVLSIAPGPGGAWVLQSTSPGRLQSTTILNGPDTVWLDEGPISDTATNIPSVAETSKFYRVRAQ